MSATSLPILAIVIPCYNEQEVLPATIPAIDSLLLRLIKAGKVSDRSFALYVNDGSRDTTWEILSCTAAENPRVGALNLAANVGHQNALMAGLEQAAGLCDITVSIDADLQDDTDAIEGMVDAHAAGADIVYGVRARRDTDTWFKRNTALGFYRLMQSLGVKSVYNHADFRLMSARAVRDLSQYGERNLFLRGIVPLLGYRQAKVYYDRRERMAGESKYPLGKMLSFAVDGITSFSVKPVRMVLAAGGVFLLVALGILIYVLVRYESGNTIPGWSSLILSIWFCSGVILISLGVIGEYIGKIYKEVKQRPRYSAETFIPPRH
ncbi:MAG: glycosyltransferase family 2 protein [Muribaculaceae bacterium]|nr:glycosyltransferase family 2 protein [Muribaculaceae bacterium]